MCNMSRNTDLQGEVDDSFDVWHDHAYFTLQQLIKHLQGLSRKVLKPKFNVTLS